jgi:two-component system, chemotaxis family, CheB/CheR fusion protein
MTNNESTRKAGEGFPIVGIGASAGGLDAFKKFFTAMPADSGIAFVLIPHLDPTHRSLMVELLAKQTPMSVVEAGHNMPVEANCVYIIPPNRDLSIERGHLQLSKPPERRGLQTAIDFFFRSLAADQQEKAIGIILSGTGSHGTLGLKEIKLVGGMVMVQDPKTADYDQMPQSAIGTGMVDFVLPPEEMPEALVRYVAQPYLNHVPQAPAAEGNPDQLNQILALLRARTKYDFRHYRKKMLMRRVERRMGLCQIHELADYLEHLREHPEEATALYKDLLIGVTAFFREPEAYQVLEQRVVPELVQRQTGDVPLRVWVPACATGEEAYSLAMLLLEQFFRANKPPHIQIFASDLDEQSLDVGRQGIYPDSIAGDVSSERRERFFLKIGEHDYRVTKQLRESIVFASQNVISDAPFSKLDLISCRNLLIYLEPEIQEKVISLFHFALSDDGFLLLGPSESIGRRTDLFDAISKKWRVYRRLGSAGRNLVEIPIVAAETRRSKVPGALATPRPPMGFAELTQRLLLADYAPAAVLINRRYEILYFFGPTMRYLELPTGEPTKDLMTMARQGLRTKVRAACHKALREGETVTDSNARALREGSYVPCTITVKPVTEPKEAEGLLLVTFEDRPQGEPNITAKETNEDSSFVPQLELELKTTREDLQATIQEQDNYNEELRASNEEVMSTNEELQSTNEELETSKEELQSLNEELNTVNNQLQDKLAELEQANNDLTNLFDSTDVATVFLDPDLRIRRFTPTTSNLLNLMAADVGRSICDIAPRFTADGLMEDARRILENLPSVEKEVSGEDGRCYLRRILPYRTADNRIEGVVVTYIDISDRKRAEQANYEARLYAEEIIETVREPLLVLDGNTCVRSANPAFYKTFQLTPEETENRLLCDLGNRQWDIPPLRTLLEEILSKGEDVADYQIEQEFEHIGRRTMLLNARTIRRAVGRPDEILLAFEDVTERKRSEEDVLRQNAELEERVRQRTTELESASEALRRERDRVQHYLNVMGAAMVALDTQGKVTLINQSGCEMLGLSEQEVLGKDWFEQFLPDRFRGEVRQIFNQILSGECARVEHFENPIRRPNGIERMIQWHNSELKDDAGRVVGVLASGTDLTDRKRAEQALRYSEDFTLSILASPVASIAVLDRDGRILAVNGAWEQFARENGESTLTAVGVGVNYLAACRAGMDSGDEFAAKALNGLRGVIDGDRAIFTLEYPCHTPTEDRWFQMTVTPARIADGGVVVAHLPITDRKRAEEALRENESRLSAIVETAADAIITIDERGIIDSINPATVRLFGYTQEELIGRNIKLLMPPPYCDEHDGYLARYLKTGEAKIIGIGREVKGRRKDGSIFPVDLAISEIQDRTGRLFTGIIRDITERKADQARLVQSERLAALGEAMAGLAHESRNALARGQGNLQRLARRLKDNDELLQMIEGALRANDDIRRQFEEVREYAAPIQLQPELLQLPEVIHKAWDELAPDRKGRKATLRIDRPDSDVTCVADAFSLRNVFRNILENSLAACEDPVEIDIEFANAKIDHSAALRISIRDNGPGLPPDVMERAFNAFFTTKTRGTGLGLAIVQRAVEAHGGEVAFDSGRGRGAEITITLPRKRSPS